MLDEAHLYTGTLAAEITLLLRRVRDRCGVSPEQITHIATSATLGGTKQDLESFAATVFSVPRNLVKVVKGEIAPLPSPKEFVAAATPCAEQLAQHRELELVTLNADGEFVDPDPDALRRLRPVLSKLLPDDAISSAEASAKGELARFLKLSLEQVPIVRRLMELVHDKGLLSIDNLACELWGNANQATRDATILLLRLTAAARLKSNESPLIPHRLHFLVRAPQGLAACLNTSCPGPTDLRAEGIGCLQAPRDRCVYPGCNSVTLPVHRCKACGQWALAGYENSETGELESGHFAEPAKRRYYLVADAGGKDLSVIIVNPETGEYFGKGTGTRLFRAPCPEHGASCNDPSKCTQQQCPNCATSWGALPDDADEDDRDLQIQPLRGANGLP